MSRRNLNEEIFFWEYMLKRRKEKGDKAWTILSRNKECYWIILENGPLNFGLILSSWEARTSFAKSKSWSLDHPWSGYPAAFHKASCVTVYRLRTT